MNGDNREIVVGVDGSEESNAALRWAVEEARLRGRGLAAVHAWVYPSLTDASARGRSGYANALRRDAEELLDAAITEAAIPDDVPVRRLIVEGDAADALIEASEGAELLVVGSRPLGSMAGVLLGSVSRQCAREAACPVVIVRHGEALPASAAKQARESGA
jgi:nucleotide-binding universal stress UspA family protein